MIFTCPGIANPIENKRKRIFPEIVIDRAIAKAAMVARRIVMKTEADETKRLLRAGIKSRPELKRCLKLSKLQESGSAKGSEIILVSDLKAPNKTIEHGTRIITLNIVSSVARIDLYNIT